MQRNPSTSSPPDYAAASRGRGVGSISVTSHGRSTSSSTGYLDPFRDSLQISTMRPAEKVVYTFNLTAGNADMEFLISVQPKPGSTTITTFSLFMKAGRVERQLGEPVELHLSVDARQLQFAVFVFCPKVSLPAGCRWAVRVWLRVNGIDHRLFSDEDVWVGRDPDFASISDASFARLCSVTRDTQTYQGTVGRAVVDYVVRWRSNSEGHHTLSLEYEAGGVSRVLFDDLKVTFQCDPSTVIFLIYTIPMSSNPPGASHRIRMWLRTPAGDLPRSEPTSPETPITPSFIFQRLWKSDELRLGSHLDFAGLGKIIMGRQRPEGPQVINMDQQRMLSQLSREYTPKQNGTLSRKR